MEQSSHVIRNALQVLQGIIRHNCQHCERECKDLMLEKLKQAFDAYDKLTQNYSRKER